MAGPLDGIKIVDFSRVLAGPLCARTLLDLGAEVIKIEPPRPDLARAAFPNKEGMSGYFAQQNSGKRNLSIDLNAAGSRELVLRLCDAADVVVENFRAGTLPSFGLDYETLAARNPRLVYVSITGYGQNGPWRHRMAYAPTVQAESGFTSHSLRHYGEALTAPRSDALSHADVYTGMQAVIGVLAALTRRNQTGVGQHIDVSMAATMLAINERAHVDLGGFDLGYEPAALGAADCPFFDAPGGETIVLAMSLVGSLTFPFYVSAMRRPDLLSDSRFLNAECRSRNRAVLHAIVQRWIMTFGSIGDLDAQFDEAKIAMGRLRSTGSLADSEWAEYWGATQMVSDRSGGKYRLPGRPWKFSRDALTPIGIPALQGENNTEICAELGLTQAEIEKLVAGGALVFDARLRAPSVQSAPTHLSVVSGKETRPQFVVNQ